MADEPTLTLAECRELITFYAAAVRSSAGSVKPLRAFARSRPAPAGRAARSCFAGLAAGLSYEAALRRCRPHFPAELQSLIVLGCERSALDVVLTEIAQAFEAACDETALREIIDALLEKHRYAPPTTAICSECLEDELAALFAHAQAAGADEALVGWEDGVLTQVFLGPKAVRLTVAASRSVFETMKSILLMNAVAEPRHVGDQELRVERSTASETEAVLRSGGAQLTVRFT